MGQAANSNNPVVGFISYALDRNLSGIGHYSLNLLQGLLIAGYTPLIINSEKQLLKSVENTNRNIKLYGAEILPALLTIGQIEISWNVRRRGIKLVHDPTGTIPLGLCAAKKIVTICDAIPFVYPQYSTRLDRLIYHYWLPTAIRRMDRVITISQQSKSDIQQYLHVDENKITVTSLAARPEFQVLDDAKIESTIKLFRIERPYIIFVGSVEPRKNLLRLLEAYAELLKWSSRWKLVIVGASNYWKTSPVAEKVEQLGLNGKVIFTGYIPDEDLPSIYNGAELFCFPSLYEGFGLPVFEAMACGVPVITSNCSALPEVAGEAAILVDPQSVDELYTAMRRILSDPQLSAELREKGLERAAQFSWQRTARETIGVYENVLGEKLI